MYYSSFEVGLENEEYSATIDPGSQSAYFLSNVNESDGDQVYSRDAPIVNAGSNSNKQKSQPGSRGHQKKQCCKWWLILTLSLVGLICLLLAGAWLKTELEGI